MEPKTTESEVLLYEQNLRKDLTSLCFTQTFWIEGQGQIQSDQCNDSKIGAFLLQKIVFIPYASIQDGTNFQNGTSKKQFETSKSHSVLKQIWIKGSYLDQRLSQHESL